MGETDERIGEAVTRAQESNQFDMAEATLSVAIALAGVTALTRKRWLLGLALLFAAFGGVLGVAGFMGFSLHPDALARLLS